MAELAARDTRIAVRRARVAARLLAANTALNDCRKSRLEIEKEAGVGDKQLPKSLHDLANLKVKLHNDVRALREAADVREFEHRTVEAKKEEELASRVRLEIEDSNKHNDEIAARWTVVTALEVPQALATQIANQRKACDAVFLSKHAVIEEIFTELKAKDAEYYLSIEQQAKDIDDFVTLMACQVAALNDAHKNELTTIELAFLQQRQSLLASNREEMRGLMRKRLDLETKFQEDMEARKEEFAKALEDIRNVDMEEYNSLKICLESDMQTLLQHHATMQAVYQFNSEKLEYNHLVLIERDHENYITANQQKRKLNKQRDTLSTLKGQHAELENRFIEQNSKLAVDFARVTKLLQDLQNQEHGLLQSHANVRRNFFCMHQRALTLLVSKVLQADKDIHENQLGWHWRAPSDQVFLELGSSALSTKRKKVPSTTDEFPEDLVAVMSQGLYTSLLGTLCDEALFLVDDKTREELSTVLPSHGHWLRAVSILQALGIRNTASLEKLRISLKGKELDQHSSIDKYMSSYLQAEADATPSESESSEKEYDPNGPPGTKLSKQRSVKLKWENYWKGFSTVINFKVLRTWDRLEQGLTVYHKLLEERLLVASKVIYLKHQNWALCQAFHHCLNKYSLDLWLFEGHALMYPHITWDYVHQAVRKEICWECNVPNVLEIVGIAADDLRVSFPICIIMIFCGVIGSAFVNENQTMINYNCCIKTKQCIQFGMHKVSVWDA